MLTAPQRQITPCIGRWSKATLGVQAHRRLPVDAQEAPVPEPRIESRHSLPHQVLLPRVRSCGPENRRFRFDVSTMVFSVLSRREVNTLDSFDHVATLAVAAIDVYSQCVVMATLRFLREPDQVVTETLAHFVDRMKSLLRADTSTRTWMLWAHETPHGLSIRLQRMSAPTPYGSRRSQSIITYSGGGNCDFLLNDVAALLKINARNIAVHRTSPRRRKVETSLRRAGR
jgi:hypothetical protein